MKNRLLVSAVGVPLLLAVLILLPPVATMVMTMALSAVAAHELLHAVGAGKKPRLAFYAVVFSAAVPLWCFYGRRMDIAAAALLALFFILFLETVLRYGRKNSVKFGDVTAVLFAAVVIPLMLSCLTMLRMEETYGKVYVLAPLVAAFSSDSMALFAGMAFGKHKLAPRVSPKKTVEGAIGGILGGVVGMLIYGLVVKYAVKLDMSLIMMAVYGVAGSILGQMGDLSFSAIKREYNIKDYGKLLPGHGGVLDRFDSVIFVAPAFWLALCVL